MNQEGKLSTTKTGAASFLRRWFGHFHRHLGQLLIEFNLDRLNDVRIVFECVAFFSLITSKIEQCVLDEVSF